MAHQHTSGSTLRTILIIVAVIVLFPILMMVFTLPMMGGWTVGYAPITGGYGGFGVFPLWGLGMMLIFLVVLLGVAYFLYRSLVGQRRAAAMDPALEELRHAYARGELTDEEYESRREKLQAEREEQPE